MARVVLGVCGGIAAYKAVEICRRLVDAGVGSAVVPGVPDLVGQGVRAGREVVGVERSGNVLEGNERSDDWCMDHEREE